VNIETQSDRLLQWSIF